jgi:uncharacterized protein (TIGR03437 family)
MKYFVFLPILFTQLTALVNAAPPVKKQPLYRQHKSSAKAPQLPRAAGDPVVVNSASFEPGVSPGGFATIFGQGLSRVNGVVIASTNPLPTQLADISVVVNGFLAPLFSVAFANGENQISFQVPYEAPTGPGAALLEVFSDGNLVATIRSDSFDEDPGIFVYNGNFAIAQHGSDGSLIGPDNPANPGEIIVLYTTGLGPLSLHLTDGVGAPSNPLAFTVDPFRVVVDGEDSQVFFSGLTPGFVGLYQINFRVPSDARAGDLDLQILSDFANSRIATLPVQ